jgi:hypothetical protein
MTPIPPAPELPDVPDMPSTGIDTKTILVIGGVAIGIIFLLNRGG